MIAFTVAGCPVSQPRQRHRAFIVNGKAISTNYTPKSDPVQSWKAFVRQAARDAGATLLEGPIKMEVTFYLPRPARLNRKKDTALALFHDGSKDIDNLYKAVADCLIGICYADDRQIAVVQAAKLYHEKGAAPRAEILIESLGMGAPMRS